MEREAAEGKTESLDEMTAYLERVEERTQNILAQIANSALEEQFEKGDEQLRISDFNSINDNFSSADRAPQLTEREKPREDLCGS